MNREWAASQTTLQSHQREAHVHSLFAAALLVGIAVSSVHLLSHVFSDALVENLLWIREFVLSGVTPALRKKLGPLEGVQVFLHQTPHQIGGITPVDGITLVAGKTVLIQQCHKQLKVVFLSVVRRRGHQQQVAGMVPDPLAHLVALGPLHLAAEVVGAHAV